MLNAVVTSIILLQILSFVDGESPSDPCLAGNHENITSMGFRHVSNKDCTQNRVTDYRLVRAWYYAGPDPILTTPPDQLCRCGANFPIWMNGSLPDPQDGIVPRDACLKYSTNCDTRFGIQVKNCGTFYVYKLPPTHEDHTAYCFGKLQSETPTTTLATTPDSSDPCLAGNHENITSMGFRQVSNKDCTQNRVTDYRLVRAWYYAGPDPILSTPPDQLCRCGANFPIWMNGTLPTPQDGIVPRDACLKYSTNCDTRFGIQVKNCGTFYVYKLPPTHEDHTAYCFATTPDSSDPCLAGNHENITSMGLRHVSNKDCTQNRVTDYRLVRAWYYAGPDLILTTPPDQLCRCGANFPIWMNGSLPDPQDGIVARDACLKYSTNCDTRFGIQVKNCGTFYVYKLPPTHEDHTAYCFGKDHVENTSTTPAPIPDSSDPCLAGNHENITSMGFRHVSNKDCTQNRVTDYRLVRAWYYAGPDPIITTPPDQLCQCGANFPIWMNGTLPTPQDGIVARDACLKYTTNCDTRFGIQVKNCGTFYVYKLLPTHEDHTAYCFGQDPVEISSTTPGNDHNASSTPSPATVPAINGCGDPNNRDNLEYGVNLGGVKTIDYNTTGVDSHVTVYCLQGYGIVDGCTIHELFQLTCKTGLKWHSTRTCIYLTESGVPNDNRTFKLDAKLSNVESITFAVSGVATMRCLEGYGDRSNNKNSFFNLTCEQDGKWHSDRTCSELQDCGDPNDANNRASTVKLGGFANITYTSTTIDSHAIVYCLHGYVVVDDVVKHNSFQLTCKDLKWHSIRSCSRFEAAAMIG